MMAPQPSVSTREAQAAGADDSGWGDEAVGGQRPRAAFASGMHTGLVGRGRDPRQRRPAGHNLPALARQAPGAAPAAASARRPLVGGRQALPDTGLPDTLEPGGSFIAFQLAATVIGYAVVLVLCLGACRAASETVLPHDAAVARASTADAGTAATAPAG